MDEVITGIVRALDAQTKHNDAVRRFIEAVEERFAEEDRLMTEMREDLHESLTALSNRIEALTRGAA